MPSLVVWDSWGIYRPMHGIGQSRNLPHAPFYSNQRGLNKVVLLYFVRKTLMGGEVVWYPVHLRGVLIYLMCVMGPLFQVKSATESSHPTTYKNNEAHPLFWKGEDACPKPNKPLWAQQPFWKKHEFLPRNITVWGGGGWEQEEIWNERWIN